MSFTVKLAWTVPVLVGVNVTAMVQLALGASVLEQELVCLKLLAFVPVMLMLLRSKVVVPLLVRTTSSVQKRPTFVVGKLRTGGLKVGMGLITVAERPTCCGLPDALSVILSVAEGAPMLPAKKNMPMRQLFPGANVAGHPLTKVKSPLFVLLPRVSDTLLMLTFAVPMFLTVTFCSFRLNR